MTTTVGQHSDPYSMLELTRQSSCNIYVELFSSFVYYAADSTFSELLDGVPEGYLLRPFLTQTAYKAAVVGGNAISYYSQQPAARSGDVSFSRFNCLESGLSSLVGDLIWHQLPRHIVISNSYAPVTKSLTKVPVKCLGGWLFGSSFSLDSYRKNQLSDMTGRVSWQVTRALVNERSTIIPAIVAAAATVLAGQLTTSV
jgi:hypothetical protein